MAGVGLRFSRDPVGDPGRDEDDRRDPERERGMYGRQQGGPDEQRSHGADPPRRPPPTDATVSHSHPGQRLLDPQRRQRPGQPPERTVACASFPP